ncbi:NUDIX domain-containing protein [Amycolatopsis sp. WAC 04169]|uniref:NUDIX hydrolase n=1 Tax=Amycolatopsis sp. WAC 04169 TaxID=2203197 RepID=UPI0018F597EA|nr:NUDIX domain-containing protein [Amycolatopsis sp. WAC 04169]
MHNEPPRIRVAAYVLRYKAGLQLLVFEHQGMPEAGTQVPAGGVRPGEPLGQAARREVLEETGLTETVVVGSLTTEGKAHPHDGRPRRTTYFQLRAPATGPDSWCHRVGGDGSDAGLVFECRFQPLPLHGPLADRQDAWLGLISPELATRAERG